MQNAAQADFVLWPKNEELNPLSPFLSTEPLKDRVLWPQVWEKANKVFPELQFERNDYSWGRSWESGSSSLVYRKDDLFFFRNEEGEKKAIVLYLKDINDLSSILATLKFLATTVRNLSNTKKTKETTRTERTIFTADEVAAWAKGCLELEGLGP